MTVSFLANPTVLRAFEEADVGQERWVIDIHIVLAAIKSDSALSRALSRIELDYGSLRERWTTFARPEVSTAGSQFGPAAYTVLGRAEGFAISAGISSATDAALVASAAWDPSSSFRSTIAGMGVESEAMYEAVRSAEPGLPAGPLPPGVALDFGPPIRIARRRLPELASRLPPEAATTPLVMVSRVNGDVVELRAAGAIDLAAITKGLQLDNE
jgi:hypothetical protein